MAKKKRKKSQEDFSCKVHKTRETKIRKQKNDQQNDRIEGALLTSPQQHNNLAAIYRQKYFYGSCVFQVENCETPVEAKTEEGCSEKRGPG